MSGGDRSVLCLTLCLLGGFRAEVCLPVAFQPPLGGICWRGLNYRPISLRARWLFKVSQRIVLAMLRDPHLRSIVIARFLKVAITRGAFPVLICERSSPKVSSLTQCRPFSMPQCMRLSSSRREGEAFSGVKLVIPYAISQVSLFFFRWVTSRRTQKTCPTCGKST